MDEADPLEEASQTLSTGALLVTALRDLRSTQQAGDTAVVQACARMEARQEACEREIRELRVAFTSLGETTKAEARAVRDNSWPILLFSAWQAANAKVQLAFIIFGGVVVASLFGVNLPDLIKVGVEIYRGM